MRLLGWMHQKLQQATNPLKEFSTGNYCTCLSAKSHPDDHIYVTKPSFDSRYGSRSFKQPIDQYEDASPETEVKEEADYYEDEISMFNSELFHGFLAIGTLGLEPIISEPATPTFPMSLESNTKGKVEVTENDLKLISSQLEKFLQAEAEEDGCNESLARSSYVSTITLSGMQIMEASLEDQGKTTVCPLQGYLFGSLIELPETNTELRKEKVSLGEMFYRPKITDDTSAKDEGKEDMKCQQKSEKKKSASQFIKKILKKFCTSSKNLPPSSKHAASSNSNKKKLSKVLKMFSKKIHPENSTADKESTKFHKDKIWQNQLDGSYDADPMHHDEEKAKSLQGSKLMERTQCYKSHVKAPQYGPSNRNLGGNREYWIKTDADYLVLEL